MKKSLLITGGAGYLGQHLLSFATNWTTHATYFQSKPPESIGATLYYCDLRERHLVDTLLESLTPNAIIHTACSNRTAQEIDAIVPAAQNLAQAAQGLGCRFIHISTDLVFDGEQAPYTEASSPKPISPYGNAKTEAEAVVRNLYPTAVIVRPSLIYGIDPVDHQTRWLLEGIAKGDTIRLFTDEIRCPIWVRTLALALLELVEEDHNGILHIAGPQPLNRWDFGLEILAMHNHVSTQYVQPSSIAESGLVRPRNLTFNIEKAQRLLKTPLLSVSDVQKQIHSST